MHTNNQCLTTGVSGGLCTPTQSVHHNWCQWRPVHTNTISASQLVSVEACAHQHNQCITTGVSGGLCTPTQSVHHNWCQWRPVHTNTISASQLVSVEACASQLVSVEACAHQHNQCITTGVSGGLCTPTRSVHHNWCQQKPVCVCVCMRACVHVCVRACVHACVHACVCTLCVHCWTGDNIFYPDVHYMCYVCSALWVAG